MSEYLIAIRRESGKPEEIHSQARTERIAISRAERVYSQLILDSVAVIEVDLKSGLVDTLYKHERLCKHSNVQFTLTVTGVLPICEGCGLVMVVEKEDTEDG